METKYNFFSAQHEPQKISLECAEHAASCYLGIFQKGNIGNHALYIKKDRRESSFAPTLSPETSETLTWSICQISVCEKASETMISKSEKSWFFTENISS